MNASNSTLWDGVCRSDADRRMATGGSGHSTSCTFDPDLPAPRGCAVVALGFRVYWDGRYTATWKRKFKIACREAGPPNDLDDQVDSDQKVVNK